MRSVERSLPRPDGTTRTYHVYVPPTTTPGDGPVPLLVALHGGGGWGTQFEQNSGFDEIADVNGFIVVYPDGTRIPTLRNGRVWNGGRCCGIAAEDRNNVDDVGFISAVIDAVSSEHQIDPAQVYVTGHSNGAIMAYRLACELSDRIAAVAFQAGALEIQDCRPSRTTSMLHLHGEADQSLPIDGGRGNGPAGIEFTSPRASIETFASISGCPPDGTVTVDPDNPDVTTTRWAPCRDGATVEFVAVASAGHAWMGRPGTAGAEALVGSPYPKLDASALIWTFLSQHPRP